MSGNANVWLHKLQHLNPKFAVNGSAGVATLVPTYEFGQFLNTHGIGVLSWAEIIKIIGAIWVTFLILEATFKYSKKVLQKLLETKKKVSFQEKPWIYYYLKRPNRRKKQRSWDEF